MDDRAQDTDRLAEVEAALARCVADMRTTADLAVRAALEEVRQVIPDAAVVEVHGSMNEDWLNVLRIKRVRSAAGEVLFDVDAGADAETEDFLHLIGTEVLDNVIDFTGDDYMGTHQLAIEAVAQREQ